MKLHKGQKESQQIEFKQSVSLQDLKKVYALQGVDLDKVYGLLKSCPIEYFAAGQTLIAAGEPSTFVCILLSGKLRVHLKDIDNEPLSILYPGEIVGEVGVIDRLLRTSHVIAEAPSCVLRMNTQTFWSLIYASHEFTINLLAIQSHRLRDNTDAIRQITQLKERYQRHAIIDGLTGLYNRRWMNEMLPRQIKRSLIDREPLSIVMIDIDFFKDFNDTFGHQTGDFVLYEIGRLLKKLFRPSELVVRYGGEEFTVILPGTPQNVAFSAAERVRKQISRKRFPLPGHGQSFPVTLSMGVALLQEAQSMEQLLEAADTALYRAKQAGRNRVMI